MTAVRTLVALLSLVALLGLAACGQEEQDPGGFQTENAQVAETEGIYVDLDELKYQVQISRQLNPLIRSDAAYFEGISRFDRDLASDEVWFGVWMRVENDTEKPIPNAEEFEIHDTQDNIYRPIPVDPEVNPFVYEAVDVPPKTVLPLASSAAGQGPTQGLLLLFKLKVDSLQNRPLELVFSNGGGTDEGTYHLDV